MHSLARNLARCLPLLTGLVLAACSSSDSGGGGAAADASLTLTVTDAASDDLSSFVLDITAIQLTRPGGATVGVLADRVTVDFVTLDEASQVLNILTVPAGLYESATVTLDFTAASAYIIDERTPAAIVDSDGNPLTGSITLPVLTGSALNAIANRNRILELDFDLNQSVMVDVPTNTVIVEPALVMRVDRSDPKEFVVAGEVQSVDAPASQFVLQVQTLSRVPITTITVQVAASTAYQIDGVPFVGAAGLTALAALPAGTWVQLYGSVDAAQAVFHALYVEAGTGTYNGGTDIVEGHVVERVGGAGADATLTVLGHSNNAAHTTFRFNTLFTVNLDFADTKVLRRGEVLAYDADDINIGQRVRVFGALTGRTMDATTASSVVRLQITRVLGFANAGPSAGTLDLDLVRVGLRLESAFTWTDGGTTPADPDSMKLAIGGLAAGLGIAPGVAVEAHGHFSAVDDGDEDFVAASLTNRDRAPSLVLVHDRPMGLEVMPTATADDITFAISGTPVLGEFAVVDRGFVGVTALPTSPDFVVTPAAGLGIYAIRDRQTGFVAIHLTFDAFTSELNAFFGLGASVYNWGSIGSYDPASNSMATFLVIAVVD